MKLFCFRLLLGSILALEASLFAQIPPQNDAFENRTFLNGSSVTFTGTLANATWEYGSNQPDGTYKWGEPNPPNFSSDFVGTVWWSWTATDSSWATLGVLNFSTNDFKLGSLEVWKGSDFQTFLTFVEDSPLYTGRRPFFTFPTIAGTIYHIRLLGPAYGDFTLKLTETNSPVVIVQPLSRAVVTNGSAFFGVVATGEPPIFYQWRCNGTNLPNETFPILSFDNLTTNLTGRYSVLVSNATGVATSEEAILDVTTSLSAPELVASGYSDGAFHFRINGANRFYRIEFSTNLFDWLEQKSFPKDFVYTRTTRPRNGLVYNGGSSFSVPKTFTPNFYRAAIYVSPNEVCVNNLGKIRFAKESWMLKNKLSPHATPTVSDLMPYLKSALPVCPLDPAQCGSCSYDINPIYVNPACLITSGHLLEEPEF